MIMFPKIYPMSIVIQDNRNNYLKDYTLCNFLQMTYALFEICSVYGVGL